MADRTSAEIFGRIFARLALAESPDTDFANWLWELGMRYDFSWDQMEADNALGRFDLVRLAPIGSDDDVVYKGEAEFGDGLPFRR